MKDRLNLQNFFFRANLTVTGIVFFLLAPNVYIYQSWFPDKKDELWLLPVIVTGISALLWFFASLSIPLLIRWGWIKDLRINPREEAYSRLQQILRIFFPVLVGTFHLLLMILFSYTLVIFLRTQPFEKIFLNV